MMKLKTLSLIEELAEQIYNDHVTAHATHHHAAINQVTRAEAWSMACQACHVDLGSNIYMSISIIEQTLQEIRDHIITDKSKMPI